MSTGIRLWLDILDGEDEPTRETCVAAANMLVPTTVFVNLYEVRDSVIQHLRGNPQMQHEARVLAVLKVHEDETRAVDLGTVHPDAFDDIDCISWDAVPEVLCLGAIAALHNNQPTDAKEAWMANGDAARDYLSEALYLEPGHNLARTLVQQGDLLAPVSGGVA